MACTSIALKGLAKDCTANLGGIKKVIMAPYSANTFSTAGEHGKIHCYTLTASTANWYAFYVKKNSSSASSEAVLDQSNGIAYVTTHLNLVFPKMTTEKREELEQLRRGELVVCFKDCNNHWFVMGVNRPVSASNAGAQSGQNFSDPNNFSIELESNDDTFCYELNNVSSQAADACSYPTSLQGEVWVDPHQHTEPYGG